MIPHKIGAIEGFPKKMDLLKDFNTERVLGTVT